MNAATLYRNQIQQIFKSKMLYFKNSVSYFDPISRYEPFSFSTDGEVTRILESVSLGLKPPKTGKNPFDVREIEYFAKDIAEQHVKIVHSSIATELANAKNEYLASDKSKVEAIIKAAKAFFNEKEIPEEYQRIMVGPTLLPHLNKLDSTFGAVGFGYIKDNVWYINQCIGNDGNKLIAYAYSQAAIGAAHSEVARESSVIDYEYDKEYIINSGFDIASAILNQDEILKIKA